MKNLNVLRKMTLLVIVLLTSSMMLMAQTVPQQISFQGKLMESGAPVTGLRDFVFSFVGTAWSEAHNDVPVNNGVYAVTLGEFIPIPVSIFNNNVSMNLRITVEGTTLTPDVPITSSGYAIKAEKSDDTKKISGQMVSIAIPSDEQILKFSGGQWTPANLQWTTVGSNIFYNSGNVGIGLTAPATQLHTTGGVRFAGLGGTGTVVGIDGSGNLSRASVTGLPDGVLGQTLNHNGVSWVATSNLINDGVNIGIGTASPVAQLHTTGSVCFAGISGTGSVVSIDGSGNLSKTAITGVPTGTGGQTLFHNGSAWTASSNLTHNGTNVGIGTDTPSQQLEITKSFRLPSTTNATTGVIFKEFYPFIHDFYNAATNIGLNTFLGISAGNFTMGGTNFEDASANTGIGMQALHGLTTGSYNTGLGISALMVNNSGSRNVGIGSNSLINNNTGNENTAIGHSALAQNTTGVENTAVGCNSGYSNMTGSYNAVYGNYAGFGAGYSSYSNNCLFGYQAAYGITTGSNNVLIGYKAGSSVGAGSNNVILGYNLNVPVPGGSNQMVLGHPKVLYGDLQNLRVGIGTTAPTQQLEITQSMVIPSTFDASTGILFKGNDRFLHDYAPPGANGLNIFIGRLAGNLTTMSAPSTFNASRNIGMGFYTLNKLSTGYDNVAVGTESQYNTSTGYFNTSVGSYAMFNNLQGYYNSAIGYQALNANTSGYWNTAIGANSLYYNVSGKSNVVCGNMAALNTITGEGNAVFGSEAGKGASGQSYSYNSIFGSTAGFNLTTGSTNILIGYSAGNNITSGSNNIVIGPYKNVPVPTGNSQMVIGDPNLLFGDLVSLRLGIGTTAPNTQLHTTGLVRFAGLTGSGGYVGIDAQGLLYKTTVPSLPGGSNGYTLRYNGTTWESSSMLYNSGSYIGIGKTDPAYALDLYGSGRFQNTYAISPLLVYGNGATAAGYISNDHGYATCYGAYGVCTNANALSSSSGVYGQNYGYGYGVYGYINNTTAMAISGYNANSSNIGNLGGAAYGAAGFHTNGNFGYIGYVNNGVYADLASSVDGDYAIYGSGVDVGGVLGSGYGVIQTNGGVKGYNYYGNEYTFGVAGYSYLDYNRSGGTFGAKQDGTNFGILSYKNSSGTVYGGYFTTYTTGTGKSPGTFINNGLGSWGDLFGADIHGRIYGTYTEGENYGLFANGMVFRNDLDIHLQEDATGKNQALYTHVSTDATIMTAGTGVIHSGSCSIAFNESFSSTVSNSEPIIISLTPIGTTGNLYLKSVSANGFEAGDESGKGEVSFSFIAIGKRKGYEHPVLPQEVVAADYTDKLSRGLHNDTDMTTNGQGLYFQNGQLTVGIHPSTLPDPNKPTENPENATFKKINTQPRVEPMEIKRGDK